MKSQNNHFIKNESSENQGEETLESLSELAQKLLAKVEQLQNVKYENELQNLMSDNLFVTLKTNIDFYDEIQRLEIYLIKSALKQARGCQKCASRLLNLNATTLNTKIKHLGINLTNSTSSRTDRSLKHQHSNEEGAL